MMPKNVIILLVVALSSLMAQSDNDPHSLGWLNEDPRRVPWMKEDRTPAPPALPDAVDHSAHMPPVGSQGSSPSCTAWAICYYYKTYQEWMEHGWSVLDSAHQFSPAFAYNQACRGGTLGSYASDVMKVIVDQGCANLLDAPFNASDHTTWPSETAYYHALPFRAQTANWIDCRTDQGILNLKAHLAAGDNADLGFYVWGNYDNISNYDTVYCVADKTGSNRGGHHNCIVGYDDNRATHDGPGAFRVVNSWGTGWGNHGYAWISYAAIKDASLSGQWVCYLADRTAYSPSITARYRADHAERECVSLTVGIGPSVSPYWIKSFYNWQLGVQAVNPFPSHDIILDLSDGAQYLNACDTNAIYIQMQDDSADGITGTIRHLTAFSSDWGEYSRAADSLVPIPDDGTPAIINLDLPAQPVQWQCAQHFPARSGFTPLTGAIDSATVRWTYHAGSPILVAPVIADLNNDGKQDIVITPLYGRITALDGATGETLWTAGDSGMHETPPAIADLNGDGRLEVVCATSGSSVYALRGADGSVLWTYPLGGMIALAPAVADLEGDGKPEVVFSASGNPWAVIALNGEDGSLLWQHPVPSEIFNSAVAVADVNGDGEPEVAFGSMDHNLYVLAGHDGSVVGHYDTGNEIWYSPTIGDINADGRLEVVVGAGYQLYAVRGDDDSLLWTSYVGGEGVPWPAIGDVDGDGRPEVVTALGDSVRACNGEDGTPLWAFPAIAEFASPQIADINNDTRLEVTAGSDDHHFYALNGATGAQLWSFTAADRVTSSALGDIDNDGRVEAVVTDYGGNVYALDDPFTAISERTPRVSATPHLRVFPNPCTDLARITYTLPAPADIRLALYDASGRLVRPLISGRQSAGSHTIRFSGFGLPASRLAAGVYFLSLEQEDQKVVTKVVIRH